MGLLSFLLGYSLTNRFLDRIDLVATPRTGQSGDLAMLLVAKGSKFEPDDMWTLLHTLTAERIYMMINLVKDRNAQLKVYP